MAEEVALGAGRRGATALWGRCWESEGAPPFWPWVQILRRLIESRAPLVLRAELGIGAASIAELVPELRVRLTDLVPPPPGSAEERRFQLFDAVTSFLTNVSLSQPLVLVLDDLHWADKPSLLLLQFLLQHLGGARLLVLGTYRNVRTDQRPPFIELLPSLRRERAFDRLVLAGLHQEAVGDLVTGFLRQPLDPRGHVLARVLRQETEGNPFFIQEELRYLIENQSIVRREGHWDSDVTSVAELGLPDAVREVIGRRLANLSETSSALLVRAAVIGREFEITTLERVSDRDEATVGAALDEAEAAGILEEIQAQPGRYRLRHALFQEALYAALPSNAAP